MAKGPRAAAPELEDEELEEGNAGQENEGDRDEAGGGEEEASDDAALDAGSEQETGVGEDVDDELEEAPSRGETRQQRLANENRELRERLTSLEARSNQPAAPVRATQIGETDEQFTARIALLNPEERIEARLERSERRNAQHLQQAAFQQAELTDKASYDAKATVDPRYKRYAGQVEAKRNELMSQGMTAPREAILKFLLGEKILANSGSPETRRAKQKGQDRVQRQQARPSGGRSDVAGTRRGGPNEAQARAKRLENLDI